MAIKSLLSKEVRGMLLTSVESELYASNLYKHLANQFQRMGLFGMQKYFLNESKEELVHYQKLIDFINDMGDVIQIPEVPKISDQVKSISDALNLAYQTELDLMKQYQKFYEESEDEGDCVTATFLIEFLQIQRKSVGEYGDLISRLENNPNDVFELDEYMGELVTD